MIGLLNSEFRKVVSLRFWWILGLVPLVVGAFSGAVTLPLVRAVAEGLGGDGTVANSVATVFGVVVALFFVVLFGAVFAAVNVGTEFRYGTVTPTFTTTRSRDGVLAAKLAVTSLFGLGYCLVVVLVSSALLLTFSSDADLTSTWPGLLGSGLVVALAWTLIGAGLGLVTRSTVGATVTLVVWFTIGELVVRGILSGLGGGAVGAMLPMSATVGTVVNGASSNGVEELPLWPGAPLTLLFWALALVAAGWFTVRTRDVT
ncbi:ABC transporter permease subunit [Rhodococcus triatomae]|uniref:ABC-2 family transporter protein n=1 Tax=Rhodococcus triatomae TaxID=300028 RepID=A0A1G7Z7L7_9NOCA|nr:ABC transporter permease [Rhodococcus triatomae]QNG18102.1 ABC transporter permease subunit [Rhodococcus triatomae]QNG22228.1 ABC transporter permease subunit [Rhodococcus triatomae]SDH04741.1 ABC-2 family transporter protein [Rhodococcus triatomae]